MSDRQTARSLKISHSTVKKYVKRAERSGLSWPLPENISEATLRTRLFHPKIKERHTKPQPDWQKVADELCRPGVTRMLLWQEYITENPNG